MSPSSSTPQVQPVQQFDRDYCTTCGTFISVGLCAYECPMDDSPHIGSRAVARYVLSGVDSGVHESAPAELRTLRGRHTGGKS